MLVVLGLGSNQGDQLAYMRQAKELLSTVVSEMRCSPVYESLALLPQGAPKEWDIPFFNMAISGETDLEPDDLLEQVKLMEKTIGRQDRGHWGPREIDIDILVYGNEVVSTPDLIIPHAGLLVRDFALVPLADIEPDWVYPVNGEHKGKTAKQLAGAWIHSMEMLEERVD